MRAQSELIKMFPELISPIPCILPLTRHGLKSKLPVIAALKVFDALGSFSERGVEIGKVLSKEEIVADSPRVLSITPDGALLWWDALIKDPHALVDKLQHIILSAGGEIKEGVEVKSVVKEDSGFIVKVVRSK